MGVGCLWHRLRPVKTSKTLSLPFLPNSWELAYIIKTDWLLSFPGYILCTGNVSWH